MKSMVMLANAELSPDFTHLNQQFKELVSALIESVDIQPVQVQVESVRNGSFRGFDATRFYLVASGSLTARYLGRTVYLLDEGDLLLPDIAGTSNANMAVVYGSEAGASLYAFPGLELMQKVFS
ncbi:MAG TPA: DNA-binding protein, partial [Halieaceae bacterium]|nr:DNA-binding protein [Halieaceae bacterium]